MSTSIGLPLNAGQLPYSCYPSDPQKFYLDMFQRGSALTGVQAGLVISDSKPAVEDQNKLWVKTLNAQPVGQFVFFNGLWVWPHPVPASGQERRIWIDTVASLATYDGGDNNAAGPASGPMWQIDSSWPGSIPINVGQVPDGGPLLNVNDSGGSLHATIKRDYLPTDRLEIGEAVGGNPEPAGMAAGQFNVPGSNFTWNNGIDPVLVGFTNNIGKGQSMPLTLPPYKAVYFIKRTSRVLIVG